MSHFIACCWYLLQQYEINQGNENTWLQKNDFNDREWYAKYIQCYYWATATIMLIGTSGTTDLETFYCNFILFFTVGIFAYILENVAQTINSITKDSMEYKANLEILNKYMKKNNLDQDTQVSVRQQLEFCYKSSQEINTNKLAVQVLEQLPDNLSTKIRNQINKSIIKKFYPIVRNFSKKTVELAYENPNIISETSYVSQQLIFQQNEPQEINIYLVLGGEVELFHPKTDEKEDTYHKVHIIKKVQAGELFGVECFFSGQVPKYSARCTQFTNICRIKRQGFINLLKYNQAEHEKFCTMKDEISQQGVTKYYNRQCILCSNHKHSEINCQFINYNPRRYQLYLEDRFQKTFTQIRKRYFRDNEQTQMKRINSLSFIETNSILNEHFNYKYPVLANINHTYYKICIQKMYQLDQYISDSYSDDDDYFDSESYISSSDTSKIDDQNSTQTGQNILNNRKPSNSENQFKQQKEKDPSRRPSIQPKRRQSLQVQLQFEKPVQQTIPSFQWEKSQKTGEFDINTVSQKLIQEKNTNQRIVNNEKKISNGSNTSKRLSLQNQSLVSTIQKEQIQIPEQIDECQSQSYQSSKKDNSIIYQESENNQSKLTGNNNNDSYLEDQIQNVSQNQNQRPSKNEFFRKMGDAQHLSKNIEPIEITLKNYQEAILKQMNNQVKKQFQKQMDKQENQYQLINMQLQQNLNQINRKQSLSKSLNQSQTNTTLNAQMTKRNLQKQQSFIRGESRIYKNVLNNNNNSPQDSFILEFDRQYEFDVYFSKYNLSIILRNYIQKFQQDKKTAYLTNAQSMNSQQMKKIKKSFLASSLDQGIPSPNKHKKKKQSYLKNNFNYNQNSNSNSGNNVISSNKDLSRENSQNRHFIQFEQNEKPVEQQSNELHVQ